MNKKMKNRVMNHSAKFNQQQGVSTLLFTVLVGVSLTALSVGYISSLKTVQNSATTLHAQTQAQMQSMVGSNALGKFLSEQPLSIIQQIKSGNIKATGAETIKFELVSSNAGNFVFDIIGKSGGASSILRASFNLSEQLKVGEQKGSIFAGGLSVGKIYDNEGKIDKNADLIAEGVTLEVKGGEIYGTNSSKYTFPKDTINVEKYIERKFVEPEDLKKDANYLFTRKDGIEYCQIANLKNQRDIKAITCPSYVSYDRNTKVWSFDTEKKANDITGVFWFEGSVVLTQNSNEPFIGSVIATENITTKLKNDKKGVYYAYAPYHYYLNQSENIHKVCPENYPIQYCSDKATLKNMNMNDLSSSVKNILFLSQTLSLVGGKEKQHSVETHYYGNMIANTATNTNSASSKFNATGVLNIHGNLMLVGASQKTELQGNFIVKLSNADTTGSYIPLYEKGFSIGGIRYM